MALFPLFSMSRCIYRSMLMTVGTLASRKERLRTGVASPVGTKKINKKKGRNTLPACSTTWPDPVASHPTLATSPPLLFRLVGIPTSSLYFSFGLPQHPHRLRESKHRHVMPMMHVDHLCLLYIYVLAVSNLSGFSSPLPCLLLVCP